MKILKCPICKSEPRLTVESMDRGNGHGYPGCFSYTYECPKCQMISSGSDTVYVDKKDVNNVAIENWNKEVNRIRVIMGKKQIDVEVVK